MATYRDINYNTRIDADLLVTGNLTVNGDIVGIDLTNYYTKTQLNTSGAGGQVHWNNLTSVPSLDNYVSWDVSDGTSSNPVASSDALTFLGAGASSVSLTGPRELTISSTDTTYLAGDGLSLSGNSFLISLGTDPGLDLVSGKLVNSDKGSSQNIFKAVSVGGSTLNASSNSDSLTISGVNNISTSLSGNTVSIDHLDSDHTSFPILSGSNTFTTGQSAIRLKPGSNPNTGFSNEAVTFSTDVQYLANTPVDSLSESVKSDSSGTVIYEKDIDYSIDYYTGELTRISEGSIPASGTVYVDYTQTKSLMTVESYDGASTYFSLDSKGNIFGKSLTVNLSSASESSENNIQGGFTIEGDLTVNGNTVLGDDAASDSVAVKGEFSVYDNTSAVFTVDTSGTLTAGSIPWTRLANVPAGSTTVLGIVQLEDSVSSISTSKAATPNSVKQAYDLANSKWTYSETTIKQVKVNSAVNSDTVGGFTVGCDVPANAVFTDSDTIYEHPTTHPPSIIAETTDDLFVSQNQIDSWNSKAEGSHNHLKSDITDFTHTHPSGDITGLPDFDSFFLKSGGIISGNLEFSGDNTLVNLAQGSTSSKNRLVIGEQGMYGLGLEWDSNTSLNFLAFNNTDVSSTPSATYGAIDVTDGTLNWTGPLQKDGVDVALSTHTHSFLSDSGGTLNGALVIEENTQYPLTISDGGVNRGPIGIEFIGYSSQKGYIYGDHTDSNSPDANYSFHIGSTEAATSVVLEGGGNFFVDTHGVWHENNFSPGDYLPLTGGTITGDLTLTGVDKGKLSASSISVSSSSMVNNLNSNYLRGYEAHDIYNSIMDIGGPGVVYGCRVSQLAAPTTAIKVSEGRVFIRDHGMVDIPAEDSITVTVADSYHIVYVDGDTAIGAIGIKSDPSDYPDMSAFPNAVILARINLNGDTVVSNTRIFSYRDMVPIRTNSSNKTVNILETDDLNRAVSTSVSTTNIANFKLVSGRGIFTLSDIPTGTGIKKKLILGTDEITFDVDGIQDNINGTKVQSWDSAYSKEHIHYYDAPLNEPTNSGKSFTVSSGHILDPSATRVYKNGLRQKLNDDYVINNSTITFTLAPSAQDNITVDYDM
jgi:hypothetical protein